MSIFDLFRRKEPRAMLGPNTAATNQNLAPLAFGTSHAGIFVNDDKAMSVSAVYASVARISRDIASLPLHLYDSEGDRRRKAIWREEYRLLNKKPNNYQSAYELRETLIASVLLWGNGYAEIERNVMGAPIGLHYIQPHRVTPHLRSSDRRIEYQMDNGVTLAPGSVLHIRGLSDNGITGMSVVRQARESIGLTVAAERYGAAYFGNGATPGGVLETDKRITDPAAVDRLRETWQNRHQGAHRAGGVAVLEDGMKYKSIGIPPEDSQFLETRKFQIEDIARWFGLPAAMIGATTGQSQYKNLHEQILFYEKFTLRPWLESIESALDTQLLADALMGTLYFEHNLEGLLRADKETRYRTYEIGIRGGWLSVNEIRRLENLDPIQGGDTYGTE